MEFLLTEEYDELFDSRINDACLELIEATAEFTESVNDFGYITEASGEKFQYKLKKFIWKIIQALKDFKNHLKQQINATIRKKEYNKRLHQLREELRNKKDHGVYEVEVTDVFTLADEYVKMVEDLRKIANRFSKMNYRTTTEIDDDISDFFIKADEYDAKLTKLMGKKIKVSTQKMLDFVDKEISDQSRVMMTIADCMDELEQMHDQADSLSKRTEALGADILNKNTVGARRITQRFSSFVKKWTVKVITTIVFIFA